MGTFGSVARGLGQFGSDIGRGAELLRQQRASDAETQLRQLMLRVQNFDLQERVRKAGLPTIHSHFQTPDGSIYAIMTDPTTGEPTTRQLYKNTAKYPEFKTLQEMETWAVEHGDDALLKQSQDAIKATQRPVAQPKPTEFDEWREQFKLRKKRDPNDIEIAQWHRQPKATGEATLPDRHLKALADKWANEGIKPPAKYQAAVEEYMEDRDMKVKIKKTPQEQRLLDVANQIEPKVAQLKKLIEDAHLTDSNDWVFGNRSALMQHLRMGEYKLGKSPDQLGADLIRAAAALKVMGAAPWVQIGRGKYVLELVTQHLPDPTDTPKNMYDKAIFLQGIVDELRESMPDQGQEQDKGDPFDVFGPRK